MDLSPKAIIKIATENGWILKRINGSHHLYKSPITGKAVPIPIHGSKDLKFGTFKAIQKILEHK